MSQTNPAPGQPHSLSSTNVSPREKTSDMVTQDKQFQSLRSRDGKMDCQSETHMVKEGETEGELSLKGTLLSQDVRQDGWCPEENEQRSVGDTLGLKHPTDEASHVSIRGSLHSGNFERDSGNVADCRHANKRDLEEVQGKLKNMHVGDNGGQTAGDSVIRKDSGSPDGPRKDGCGRNVNVGDSQGQGQSSAGACGQIPAEAVPPNEATRIGDVGGERRGGDGGGGGGSKKEVEAALFPMQSSDSFQQTFSQETPSKQSGDSVLSLRSSHSEPSIATSSQYSSSSSSKFSRCQSLQTSRRKEFYDLLLIYTKEDESSCANHFRSYAASKDWKVTSTAELPIGPLSLTNFRKAMECCSYVVLLISSHFISDKACERHYNIAIQYGDRHPEFTDCVLPVIFDDAELPPELEAIQHVTWGHQYFDNVMTKSVDVQKRLDRELQEAAAVTCTSFPSRAISVDASISRTSSSQMSSTPPKLSTVPAGMPMRGTESYQTSAATQQTPRVPEQEACLMPSDDQSPVLPPIPVATASNVGATQSLQPSVAATTTGNQPQHTATSGSKLPYQPLTPATCQQQATYQQQANVAATQHQPIQYPEAVASTSQKNRGAVAVQPSSQIFQAQPTHQPATNLLPATCQQQAHVAAMQYQPSQPEASANIPQHSSAITAPSSIQIQRTISHPAQDYANMTGEEIFRSLSPEFNPGQAASQMLSAARFGKICELLDASDIRGYDWRLFAEILDLSHPQIRILEQNGTGATRELLEVFFLKNGTKGKIEVLERLKEILKTMERQDAAEHVEREILIAKCRR